MKLYVFTADDPGWNVFSVMSNSEDSAKDAVGKYLDIIHKKPNGNRTNEYDIWNEGRYEVEVGHFNEVIES